MKGEGCRVKGEGELSHLWFHTPRTTAGAATPTGTSAGNVTGRSESGVALPVRPEMVAGEPAGRW